MGEVELKIELLTRSIVSNFTARLLGPLKEAKSQKNLIFFMSRWGALTHLGAIRQKTDCNDKQFMLKFYVMKKEYHTLFHWRVTTSQRVSKGKLWYLVENKLAELLEVCIFQDRIITIKQKGQN